MLAFSIGTTDYSAYVSEFSEEKNKIIDSNCSFRTSDGVQHNCVIAQKKTYSLKMDKLTGAQKAALSALLAANTVSVAANSVTATCICKTEPYEMWYASATADLWACSLTFEEV
jgi:hypothetical protein